MLIKIISGPDGNFGKTEINNIGGKKVLHWQIVGIFIYILCSLYTCVYKIGIILYIQGFVLTFI